MLEVFRKKTHGKSLWIPNNKAVVASSSRDDMVGVGIFNDIVSFSEEWRRTRFMKSFLRLRSTVHQVV